jgi:hypothetical protein
MDLETGIITLMGYVESRGQNHLQAVDSLRGALLHRFRLSGELRDLNRATSI